MSDPKKSAGLIVVMTGLGLFLALASSLVVAATFGASLEMDVYLAASTLPVFLSSIMAMAMNATFLPAFSAGAVEREGGEWSMAWFLLYRLLPAVLLLTCLAAFFSQPVIRVLCPGFSDEAVSRGAGLLRLMLPAAALTVVNEMLAGIHYAHRRFFVPGLFKVIVPVSTILMVAVWGERLGVATIAIATFVAVAIQCVFSAAGVARMPGFRIHGPSAETHEGAILLLRRMPLLMASMVIYKSLPFFDRWLASGLPVGAISILGYAGKLSGMLQPLLVSGIALSFYPVMTELAAKRDFKALRGTLGRSLRLALFVSLPVAAYLAVFGEDLIVFLLGRGAFSIPDARETHRVFALLLVALPAMLGGTLVGQGFYALKETKTVIKLGLVETVFYILLCLALFPVLGLFAFPVTQAFFFTASFLAAVFLLSRRMGQNLFSEFVPALGRQAMSLAAGFAVTLPVLVLLPSSPWSSLGEMAAAFLVYFAVSRYVFKTQEAGQFLSLLQGFLPGHRIAGWYRGYVPPTEIEP